MRSRHIDLSQILAVLDNLHPSVLAVLLECLDHSFVVCDGGAWRPQVLVLLDYPRLYLPGLVVVYYLHRGPVRYASLVQKVDLTVVLRSTWCDDFSNVLDSDTSLVAVGGKRLVAQHGVLRLGTTRGVVDAARAPLRCFGHSRGSHRSLCRSGSPGPCCLRYGPCSGLSLHRRL